MQVIDVTDEDGKPDLEKINQPRPEPEYETVLAPLEIKAHKDECPFLGTFTFFIGS